MTKVFMALLSGLLAAPLFSQVLDNSNASIFSSEPFFNERFIRENNIQFIAGTVALKRERQPIEQLGIAQRFEFDRQGRLVRQLETYYRKGGAQDTTVVEYDYNEQGLLTAKRMNDQYGFYSYNYEYDSEGRVTSESYAREENLSASGGAFVAGRQFVIRTETFAYQRPVVHQLKKLWHNTQGKPYRELMTWYDSFGNKSEEEDRYIVTNKRARATYTYDEKHRLVELTEEPDIARQEKRVYTFAYDEVGNIVSEKLVKNGVHTVSKEYLYDPQTMLLTARLVKDEETVAINIIQYTYGFYD